jgi:hypothetical protein
MLLDPFPHPMDPSLTWEILSRISSSTASSDRRGAASDDGDDDLPFFAQRGEGGCRGRRTTSSSFVTACPIARGVRAHPSASASADNGVVGVGGRSLLLPALYSRDAIADELARVVRWHSGRATTAEAAAWLGVGEDVASDLIDGSPHVTAAPKSDGRSSESSHRRFEEDRARCLRRRVLGGLSGATVPTSVSAPPEKLTERFDARDDCNPTHHLSSSCAIQTLAGEAIQER